MAVREPPSSEYKYSPEFKVTDEVKHAFDVNGYILLRNLFSDDEVGKLRSALESNKGVMSGDTYIGPDRDKAQIKVTLWNHPGNDITGIVARSEKLAHTFGKLLGGEVYHYHAKVVMKEPHTGGAFLWHQDYGYWYENGVMFPHMGTAFIAVDKADRENGCLNILEGSHRAGRITHYRDGDQAEADQERVKQLKQFCPQRCIEVDPGDALLFHCNILHTSAKNDSDRRRWAYLVCYNRADNDPVYKHHHPCYTPLNMVPNSAIMECDVVSDMEGKDFFSGINDDDSHLAFQKLIKKPDQPVIKPAVH